MVGNVVPVDDEAKSVQQLGQPVGLIGEPAEPASAQAQHCVPAQEQLQLSFNRSGV
jgi:hypothetical protein